MTRNVTDGKVKHMKPYEKKRTEIQASATEACLKSLATKKGALIVMPTGTGKTRVGFNVMNTFVGKGKPVLWLTHRTNLKEQTRESGGKFFNGHTVSEFHGKERHFDSDVVVGMIPSLSRDNGMKMLRKQLRNDSFSLVVVDEAHHSPSSQFTSVLDVLKNKQVPCVGLTATPKRPDGQKNHSSFGEEPAFFYSFEDAVKDGTVVKPTGFVTLTNTWIKGIPNKKGEYTSIQKLLDRKIVIEERNKIIVHKVKKDAGKFWKKHGIPPKYVTFCINVRHARRMSTLFNAAGIKASVYVGDGLELSATERKETLKKFSETNEIEMLCVVDLMNEGVDVPSINTLVMARPTFSNIVYTQQLGRGTRPGKPALLVFDFVDNYTHGFGSYGLTNTFPAGVNKKDIDLSYVKTKDSIARSKQRIDDVFKKIDLYQDGGRLFYTVAEALIVCKRLGIKSKKEYLARCHEDRKLPGAPLRMYGRFFWSKLAQKPKKKSKGFWDIYQNHVDFIKKHRIKSPREYETKCGGGYGKARRNGFIKRLRKEFFPDALIHIKRDNWSLEKWAKEFRKNGNKATEVLNNKPALYQAAGKSRYGTPVISIAAFGHSRSSPKRIKNITTGIIYKSLTAASRAFNCSISGIHCAVKNGTLCKGHKLVYVKGKK